ncbi:hypothetical protein, conserved [Eimeria tenella]|uniref:Uncharacterized protein n=1 Tax=Eimeria tenella TaxID=5802 RepID=U6L0P4_EIMTE|nr:hypothetical protein, conserved [Eimeria tenella]CDJ43947.1 hypothetical protein, conserved [Eimeria tenella]|eukprot:XP_013234696.1 hypothetical protein, conserved [Eimeria tenella]
MELLGAFVRQPALKHYRAYCSGGLSTVGGLLHFGASGGQQNCIQPLQQQLRGKGLGPGAAACCRRLAGEVLRGLFSPRLAALDKALCGFAAAEQGPPPLGRGPCSLPGKEGPCSAGGALIVCSSKTAAWCLGLYLAARGLGEVECLLARGAPFAAFSAGCSNSRSSSSSKSGSGAAAGLGAWEARKRPPLRLLVAASPQLALYAAGSSSYGLVLVPEAPQKASELLQAAACCSSKARTCLEPSPLVLLFAAEAPPLAPISSSSEPRPGPSSQRAASVGFELYPVLQHISLLRRLAGPQGAPLAAAAVGPPGPQKPGLHVAATGAFVPCSRAWALLQQVLAQGYREPACSSFREARGSAAEAVFFLGPLRARRGPGGPQALELPPLKGFRETPIKPEKLQLKVAETQRPLDWREAWEGLAVKALQRLHELGVLSDNLLLQPVSPEQQEGAPRGPAAATGERAPSGGERMWRQIPQSLLAPESLRKMLQDPQSTEHSVDLYIHRVWCTPLTWPELQQEQQTQSKLQQGEAAAVAKSSLMTETDLPLPNSPVYDSGGLLGYWAPFSSKRAQAAANAAGAAAGAAAAVTPETKAAAANLLSQLFPDRPLSSVLQPLAILLPSPLPEAVVFHGVHPLGTWQGPPGFAQGEVGGPQEESGPEEGGSPELSDADSICEEPEAPGEEGLMRIEIEPPGENMKLKVPNAEALRALLVGPARISN